jgi:hypothetical protein
MTIGIVVPSLGQGRFLAQALESLLAEPGREVRVAVLDAGSTDDSRAVIRRYESRLAFWRSAPDRGQAAAVNEGVRRLGAVAYVGWLNADDLLLPRGLERLAAYLDDHPGCVAAYGRARIIDAEGRVVGDFPTRPFSRRRLAGGSIICQPASLVRLAAWERVGGLDESLHMCLDYDLWWRLSGLGAIGFLPELLACSRDHDSTKTRTQKERLYAEAFQVVRRHVGHVPWRWCLSEAAYRWRVAHDGRRASDALSQSVCAWRALVRYARVNGLAAPIRAVRGP